MVEKITVFKSSVIRRVSKLLIFSLLLFSSTRAQNNKMIDVPTGPMMLWELIHFVEARTGVNIHWAYGVINPDEVVYGTGRRMSLEQVLNYYLNTRGLIWRIEKGISIIIEKTPINIQVRHSNKRHGDAVSILVKDKWGYGIPGVTICVCRTGKSYQTDVFGKAKFIAARYGDTISCSCVGKHTVKVVVGEDYWKDVTLEEQPGNMDTVVVSIYTNRLKSMLTGTIAEIPGKDIDNQIASNPQAAMIGRIPGVQVTQTDGIFGGGFDVLIRGRQSILNGHAPLYIIDGVPFAPGQNSVSNIRSGSMAGLNPLSFIDKDDIEKIQVLIDADATAIFGARGANGVIVITTRKHLVGAGSLSIDVRRGIGEVTRLPEMMNIQQYRQMRREALLNDGLAYDETTAPELFKWDSTRNINWQKVFVKGLGHITKVHASAYGRSGLNERFFSAGWIREENVFITHPAHDLFSLNGSVSQRSGDGRWNGSLSFLAGWDKNAQLQENVGLLQFLVPNAPDLISNGSPISSYKGLAFNNPYRAIANTYTAHSHNYLISTNARYKIWDSLSLRVTSGWNDVLANEFSVQPGWDPDSASGMQANSFSANNHFSSWIIEPRLEYNQNWKDWNLSALAGRSWQGQKTAIDINSVYGMAGDPSVTSPAKRDSVVPESYPTNYLYTAWFGQLTAGWKGRWNVNFSGRKDASSRFTGNNHDRNFGAIGMGWTFSEEPFIQKMLPLLAYGKLRASYGVTGNDGFGGGPGYLEDWNPSAILDFQHRSNSGPSAQVVPDVSFERVKKTEVSMELGFLKRRILLTASWYIYTSDHQLLPDTLQTLNNVVLLHNRPAVVQNKGWELSLSTINIKSPGLNWRTDFNISWTANKLAAFPGVDQTPFRTLIVGQPLSTLNAYEYQRVDPKTGVFTFGAQTQLIHPDVRCFGGMTNTVRWNKWELTSLLAFRWGNGINYQAAIYKSNRPGSTAFGLYSNETTDLMNRWSKAGDIATYQMLTTKGAGSAAGRAISKYLSSSGILADDSYLRVKSLGLSYDIPKVFSTAHARVFVQAENLFTITPYKGADPENQSILALPPLKTIVAGFNVTF